MSRTTSTETGGTRVNGLNPSSKGTKHVKLVVLGDQGVGKSSIALRFVRGAFHERQEMTVGAAFLTHTINVRDHIVKLDIWDTAGQERYHSLAPMYYRGASAAIVVYDVNVANTFTRALAWVKELRQQTSTSVLILLAGNKTDMGAQHRAVSYEEGQAFARENGLLFAEVSAKTGMAVTEMFLTLANKLIQQDQEGAGSSKNGIQLNGENVKSSSCKC